MNPSDLPEALRRHREALTARWLRQFAANRAAAGRTAVAIEPELVRALFDEVVSLVGGLDEERIPRRHGAAALAQMAGFPDNVALCIDVYQAGSQTIGAFVVENAGPFAAWNTSARNRHLTELDEVFHILVHRELEALCELRPMRPAEAVAIPLAATTPLNLGDILGGNLFRN